MKNIQLKYAVKLTKKTQEKIQGGFFTGSGFCLSSFICAVEGPGASCGRDGICNEQSVCVEPDCTVPR